MLPLRTDNKLCKHQNPPHTRHTSFTQKNEFLCDSTAGKWIKGATPTPFLWLNKEIKKGSMQSSKDRPKQSKYKTHTQMSWQLTGKLSNVTSEADQPNHQNQTITHNYQIHPHTHRRGSPKLHAHTHRSSVTWAVWWLRRINIIGSLNSGAQSI